jgi:hypothetical protein
VTRFATVMVLAIVLAGCATIPGRTRADARLQRDVRQSIGLAERAAGGSSNAKVFDTEFLDQDAQGGWREVWVVRRGNRLIRYPVRFTPDPKGGTLFSVTANAPQTH